MRQASGRRVSLCGRAGHTIYRILRVAAAYIMRNDMAILMKQVEMPKKSGP